VVAVFTVQKGGIAMKRLLLFFVALVLLLSACHVAFAEVKNEAEISQSDNTLL